MKTITYDETKWKLMPLKATSAMVDVLEFGRKQPTHNTYLNLLAAAPTPPAAEQAQQDADKVAKTCRHYWVVEADAQGNEIGPAMCCKCGAHRDSQP